MSAITASPESPSKGDLVTIIAAATRAPSVHNTQPWRFEVVDGVLQVYADPERQLPVLDPRGRQLHMSIGVAVTCAEVTARALGYGVDVRTRPDVEDPTLIAQLRFSSGHAPTVDDVDLAIAVERRHTHRGALADTPISHNVLDRLVAEAMRSGAVLHPVTRRDDVVSLAVLLEVAERAERANAAYLAELENWLTPEETRCDGVPVAAAEHSESTVSLLPVRSFCAGPTPTETAVQSDDAPAPHVEPATAVVLLTDGDGTASWVTAGRALGRVLLRATALGAVACPLGPATDTDAARAALRRALHLVAEPQIVLRLGYPAAVEVTTPRRPLRDVAVVAER